MRTFAVIFALTLFACGSNASSGIDAGEEDAAPFMLCGNIFVEGSEECDDGNEDADDGCSPTCQLECGDGAVTGTELCDPRIDAGDPGGCPTEAECTDDDACTTGVVSGAGCEVTCEFAVNTALVDGDGCCSAGADATSDDDCTATCGNGVVESPEEVCDTGIATGLGACPTVCNDGEDCTADSVDMAGTCDAVCIAPDITTIGPMDGCCPPGATAGTDGDCTTTCGDMFVTGTETCDTAIPSGPGVCPVACDDSNVCTIDNLVNTGTCRAACTTTSVAPGPVDTCCPAGADLGDDPDCPPSCGDGIITAPETCDDNNATGSDGCSAICRIEPIGFRFIDLDLRDPHTFANALGCIDVTNFDLFGIQGVNPILQTNIQTDGDSPADGQLDLSIANTFLPLIQTAGSTSASDLVFPDCTAPMSTTSCTLAAGAPHTPATATNSGGSTVCLTSIAGTLNTPGESAYSPGLVSPTAAGGNTCYVATAGTVTFSLGGIPITLLDARIGGEWFGSPATEIRDGMIRGFLTEATADATIIPEGTTGQASIDGEPLSSLLRGGVGSCSHPSPAVGDKDSFMSMPGWYFYLNFSAAKRPYTEL